MISLLKNKLMIRMLIGIFFLISFGSIWVINTSAQSNDEGWSTPINLSNSGSTTNPQLVVDSNGTFHVVWIDEFDSYVYAQSSDGVQWSSPVPVSFPFSVEDSLPLLLPDPSGYVHAFWMDDEATLYYSRVLAAEFGNPASWSGAIGLAESALDLDAVLDSDGNLHLAYVRPLSTAQFPSGVYYRRSMDGGQSWSIGLLLYQSQYFRALSPENAHVQISTTRISDENHIYIAWDNRPIKRIYFTKSADGGNSWIYPLVMDEPGVENFATTPFNIKIQPDQDNLLAIWQSGQPDGTSCAQYYMWSNDQGSTWHNRQQMLDQLFGCPDENMFLASSDRLTFLWTSFQDQIYFLAWDGNIWSEIQLQRDLDNFIDPVTMNYVTYRCRQAKLTSDNHIYVVGCDAGEGNDIWITSGLLGEHSDWYPPPSAWSQPEVIATIESELLSPVLVRDTSNQLHLLWSQPGEPQFPEVGTSINYMRFDSENWSSPVSIFSVQSGKADQISAATDSTDHIHMVWSGDTTGEIMYSWANIRLATSPSEWTVPARIPSPQPSGSSPSIFIDSNGAIYVIYAIPINEDRGIYLVKSEDDGASWTDPRLVFDAAGASWGRVGHPSITRSATGQLHVLFKRLPPQGSREFESLHYTSSSDDGLTWDNADQLAEGVIPFSQIFSIGNSIQRVWQETLEFGNTIQHEYLLADGTTWQRSSSISNIEVNPSSISLVVASSGQLFLHQVVEDAYGEQALREFEWIEGNWILGENLQIKGQNNDPFQGILSSISSDGKLSGILLQKTLNQDTGTYNNSLWMTGHQIPVMIEIVTTEQPEITTPIPQTQVPAINTSTAIPQDQAVATPTMDLITQATIDDRQAGLISNPWIGVVLGGLLGAGVLIILIVIRKSLRR
jgi:hypothetical protein